MKLRIIRVFLFSILLIVCQYFYSCEVEEGLENSDEIIRTYDADKRLWSYFEKFENEGIKRGLSIDLNQFGVKGTIQEIRERGVAGQCQYGSHRLNEVTIDLDYWNNRNTISREFVIFHELGHCFLLRDHLEDSFSNGICVSIMRSGLGQCIDAYTNQNREYYLDELFSIEKD